MSLMVSAHISLVSALLEQYEKPNFFFRLYAYIRMSLLPYGRLVEHVPHDGILMDIGCGFGLWLNYLRKRRPNLDLEGIDTDPGKVSVAKTCRDNRVRIAEGEAAGLPSGAYDCITVLDVLYLVPRDGKHRMLSDCFGALRPGGLLLLKEVDTKPSWKYAVAKGEEVLAVKIAQITQGNALDFLSSADYVGLLENIGFQSVGVTRLDRGYPHPHVLISGSRPEKTHSRQESSTINAA